MLNIYIDSIAYLKLKYYVQHADSEISGLGTTEVIDGKLWITDIELFNQKVSATSTRLDEKAMAKFLYEKTKAGEDVSQYKVWWHSHYDFDVFWSIIDENNIEDQSQSPYLISVVINQNEDILIRLDLYSPLRLTLNCNLIIVTEDEELEQKCIEEIGDKISKHNFIKKHIIDFKNRKLCQKNIQDK